jgi:hypothetical protein
MLQPPDDVGLLFLLQTTRINHDSTPHYERLFFGARNRLLHQLRHDRLPDAHF